MTPKAAPEAKAPAHVAPSWGKPPNEAEYTNLESSWISREIADAAMLRRVDNLEGREVVGQKGKRDCSGILIPYYWPGEAHPYSYRIRRDNPDFTERNGILKATAKYLGAPGSANRLYIPPGVTPEQLADTSIPVALVEGEKKALALWRLANHGVESPRFIPIAIAGVWNWRGTVGKTGGPKGERLDVTGPIADLSRIEWSGRKVFLVFDTNVHTNDSVKWARRGIARELATRRAEVHLVNLPEDCGVNGVDDLLAVWGPERVLGLFHKSSSGIRLEVILPPQFQSRPEGMFRITAKGESQVQMTNYQAAIVANIGMDDGVEVRREFEIASELLGRKYEFTVPASEFARMDWPIERMGSSAITFPRQQDYARTAIQSLSLTAEERVIYTHTGWRRVGDRWVFLHAGGALSSTGPLVDIHVRLSGAANRYQLQLPIAKDALVMGVRESLRLVELGPPAVAFPLVAATYRSVLGEADFAVHMAGETGAFKSELAALHQQHFGAGMDRLHLPGAWSSTGNSLELLAFQVKDSLLVIDDFAPQGSSADVARYHAAADRVFRAAGNRAGRGRLDSSARLKESKPPRSLILSTGEDIPHGQSIRARMFIVELSKGYIHATDLSGCQRLARAGVYSEAMAGFLQWLAGRYEEVRNCLELKVSDRRASSLCSGAHARMPDIVANLQAGFEFYLEFAVAAGALDAAEAERLADRCWDALQDAALAQVKHQGEAEPAARFLTLLRSALASGRAHLESRSGGEPDESPEACGWRCSGNSWTPRGECIGWAMGGDIYLEPTAAYRMAQIVGRDTGETLTISEQTLKKRLREKDLLASVDETRQTLTVRRTIGGSSKAVLHFLRTTVLPQAADSEDEDRS